MLQITRNIVPGNKFDKLASEITTTAHYIMFRCRRFPGNDDRIIAKEPLHSNRNSCIFLRSIRASRFITVLTLLIKLNFFLNLAIV